jgi:hypothetical protein
VATAALTVGLLARAGADPARTGPLLAVFPPGTSAEQALTAAIAAEGTVRAQGWWPGLVEVEGGQGLAQRLYEVGARLVLAPLPVDLGALPGCTGAMRAGSAQRRPTTAI